MYKQIPPKNSLANQFGFTLLELLGVVGILLVLTTFVTPVIGNWRAETQIEKDYKALLGEIRYLQAKAKLVNGTSLLMCGGEAPGYDLQSMIINKIVTTTSFGSVPSGIFTVANTLESKGRGEIWEFPPKTGNNCLVGGTNILFLHNGKATSASIEVFKPLGVAKMRDANYTAYKITISSATGYIQLFRSKKGSDTWVEMR